MFLSAQPPLLQFQLDAVKTLIRAIVPFRLSFSGNRLIKSAGEISNIRSSASDNLQTLQQLYTPSVGCIFMEQPHLGCIFLLLLRCFDREFIVLQGNFEPFKGLFFGECVSA